ncbi:MAG: glycosyltransferase [Patescibacteria group bacterium]
MPISVIMPARNAAETIAESIGSVLTSPLVSELVIVDDLSADSTAAIAESVNDSRVKIVTGRGQGISAAFNAGVAVSSGDYIARCDADDLYPTDRLSRQREWLAANPRYGAISGAFRTITHSGESIVDLAFDGEARDVTDQLISGVAVTHFCSWLTKRALIDAVRGAREWFSTAEDLDLMFRLASAGRIWHDPRVAYFYRLHDTSITHLQSDTHRKFFESAASTFAQQRLREGSDALMKGDPPALPTDENSPAWVAAEHISNQLIGAAWSAHAAGDKATAIGTIWRAMRMQCTSLTLWKHLILICIKRVPQSP